MEQHIGRQMNSLHLKMTKTVLELSVCEDQNVALWRAKGSLIAQLR